MAFNVKFPESPTKIRDLSQGIPANWLAIQDADSTFKPIAVNFDNRTPLSESNDPSAIPNAVIVFAREDTANNDQLYAIDENSVKQQLTFFGNYTIAASGLTYLPGAAILQWFTVLVTGNTTSQTITFPTAFPNNCFNINLTPEISGTGDDDTDLYIVGGTITKTDFAVRNSTGANYTMHVQAIGN